MKYPTVFHLIKNAFETAKVKAVLIGGFAVNHYKVTRQTIDIDLPIIKNGEDIFHKPVLSMDDYRRFIECALKHIVNHYCPLKIA